jgi:hypothetical protein
MLYIRQIFIFNNSFCGDTAGVRGGREYEWDVNGVGAMDVSWSEAQRAETNAIARSDDRAVIMDVDVEPTITERYVKEVGAMDVSRSEAQRAETNVIARSDDRAMITDVDDLHGRRHGRWTFHSTHATLFRRIDIYQP